MNTQTMHSEGVLEALARLTIERRLFECASCKRDLRFSKLPFYSREVVEILTTGEGVRIPLKPRTILCCGLSCLHKQDCLGC